MGERIGIADVVFGLVIGIASWFSIMSDIPARWPWGLIAVMAVLPAALFAAMFAVCFFIVRVL